MNQFSPQYWVNMGASLATFSKWAQTGTGTGEDALFKWRDDLADIRCTISSKMAHRLACEIAAPLYRASPEVLTERATLLRNVIFDDLARHLFLWVPAERAHYWHRKAEDFLGAVCLTRFGNAGIAVEMEEAARCFACERHTATAFHLMRITEAAVKALGAAIGCPVSGNANWGNVFKQFDRQLALPAMQRPGHWQQHSSFLENIGGHLRAVKSAWRNDTMHLDRSYNEEEASHLLAVVPTFMRELSAHLDETGTLL